MNARNSRKFWLWAPLVLWGPAQALSADSFAIQLPVVDGRLDPIRARLLLTSDKSRILALGARVTYDPARVSFVSFQKGSGIPASWSFVYSSSATAGRVDVVLTDATSSAAVLNGPVNSVEALVINFKRVVADCGTSAYGFFGGAPAPPSAFPTNQYILYADQGSHAVLSVVPTTTGANGPAVSDHSFIRGNVNNQGASRLHLDLQDVIDLANLLFGGGPLINCAAAVDANDDGSQNITDLVTLVHGIFNATLITIPPPNSTVPGVDTPGVVVPDGGSIPSELGCAQGQSC